MEVNREQSQRTLRFNLYSINGYMNARRPFFIANTPLPHIPLSSAAKAALLLLGLLPTLPPVSRLSRPGVGGPLA